MSTAQRDTCDCTNPFKCLNCLLRAKAQAEALMSGLPSSNSAEEKCAAGTSRTHASIMRAMSTDLLSLIDTLLVPAEFVAAVLVTTEIQPNSAPHWNNFRGQKDPSCKHVFFFDTRLPLSHLHRKVVDNFFLNHSVNHAVLPPLPAKVPSGQAHMCVCGKQRCPGAARRVQLVHQRFGLLSNCHGKMPTAVLDELSGLAPPNECILTTNTYDRYLELAVPLMVSKTWEDVDESFVNRISAQDEPIKSMQECYDAHNNLSATFYEFWHLYDQKSGNPIMPGVEKHEKQALPCMAKHSEENTVGMCEHCRRRVELERARQIDAATIAQRWFRVDPLRALNEQCAIPGGYLELGVINADYVRHEQHSSSHATPMCALRIEEQLQSTYVTSFLFETKRFGDFENEEVDHSHVGALWALINSTLKRTGVKERAHPLNCSCLFDEYVSKNCCKQLELVMVPVPTNPLFADPFCDSIFDIKSTTMRDFTAHQMAVTLVADKEMTADAIKWDEPRGGKQHFDTAIVRYPPLREAMTRRFGDFSFSFDRTIPAFTFAAVENEQRRRVTEFNTFFTTTRTRTPPSFFERTASAAMAKLSYEEILNHSRALFSAIDSTISDEVQKAIRKAESLSEIVLLRGYFAEPTYYESMFVWLPPAALRIVQRMLSDPCQLALSAARTLKHPSNLNRIIGTPIERAFVADASYTDNRRMLMARITGCLLSGVRSSSDYQDSMMHLTIAALVIRQCDELMTLLARKPKVVQTAVPPPVIVLQEAPSRPKRTPKRKKSPVQQPATTIAAAEVPMAVEHTDEEEEKKEPPSPPTEVKKKRKSRKKEKSTKIVPNGWFVVGAGGKTRPAATEEVIKVASQQPPSEQKTTKGETLQQFIDREVSFDFFQSVADPMWLDEKAVQWYIGLEVLRTPASLWQH